MSCNYGDKISVQIFGQSHAEGIGVVIDGLPANLCIDMDKINEFLKRRQGGSSFSTPRKEDDIPRVISGLVDGKTCGAPLCVIFENKNIRSKDYDNTKLVPRPSHADLVAHIKYDGANDIRGGGHFSGRMTLPLCFAGAVCMQILEERGIIIDAHVLSIGQVKEEGFDFLNPQIVTKGSLPLINTEYENAMIEEIMKYKKQGDSVGGVIECSVKGMPIGIGEPMFDGLENRISSSVFAIPAIKGIEFGAGFDCAQMTGSQHNDQYYVENGEVKFSSNNAGGILGGISTGQPLIFKVAVKPTPSISKEQKSFVLDKKENASLVIEGRHDPCIVPRAVPCVEAAVAIAIINML